MMKNFLGWVIFIFCFLLILFKVDSASTQHQMQMQMEADKQKYERQVAELEQEIRLLKTDMALVMNGWVEQGDAEQDY